MSLAQPAPDAVEDPVARLVDYLDFFRSEVRRKTQELDHDALATSVVPSGWSLLALVEHLVHMERRWLVWGFLGEEVADARADRDPDTKGFVTDRTLDVLLEDLDAGGRRTREIASTHTGRDRASAGGMFETGGDLPNLLSILFHVQQEYARHAGHLDIARELIDGLSREE